MLEVESPTIKFDKLVDAFIARYPVKESEKNKIYYIYFVKSEINDTDKRRNEFKKECDIIIQNFSQNRLVELLRFGKKHILINSSLGKDITLKIIYEQWGDEDDLENNYHLIL